jgi:hypothetical protein
MFTSALKQWFSRHGRECPTCFMISDCLPPSRCSKYSFCSLVSLSSSLQVQLLFLVQSPLLGRMRSTHFRLHPMEYPGWRTILVLFSDQNVTMRYGLDADRRPLCPTPRKSGRNLGALTGYRQYNDYMYRGPLQYSTIRKNIGFGAYGKSLAVLDMEFLRKNPRNGRSSASCGHNRRGRSYPGALFGRADTSLSRARA